jgi:hypothetical protein
MRRARLAVAAIAALAWGCGDEGALPEGALCDPGTTIFCRCPGGDPGEKRCDDAGASFGACEGCADRPDPTGGAGAGTGGGGTTGPGGGAGEGAPLYRPCDDDAACDSGFCRFGYCTIPCAKVSDCAFGLAECVDFAGTTACMPVCEKAADCGVYGAPPSACGFATAVDNWGVTTCANWGASQELPPVGSDCAPFDHAACNLGYAGRGRVCSEKGVCAAGCFAPPDCPGGAACSSDGATLGSCASP